MAAKGSPGQDEKRTLERQIQLKDQVVVKLTDDLRDAKEKLAAAEFEARNRAAELKTLREEMKRSSRGTPKSDARSRPGTADGGDSARTVPFEHISDLENQIRVCGQLGCVSICQTAL
jgi:hypothetical protein